MGISKRKMNISSFSHDAWFVLVVSFDSNAAPQRHKTMHTVVVVSM